MATTYIYDAFLVPKIFESLVAEVSANLSSETTLSIPNVSFKHGTWIDIKKELIEQGNSPDQTHQDTKYPLVCLIHSYNEGYDMNNNQIKVDLVILTPTEKNEYIPYKYENNYAKILNPIYSELVQVMKDSNYFSGYLNKMTFPKRDLNHLGNETTQGGYELPDILDGIVMEGLDLKLARKMCDLVPCVQLYQLSPYSCIDSVEMSGSSIDNTATISFTAQGDPSTSYSIICEDASILIDAIPETPYTIDFARFGGNASSELFISGSDGSFVSIPIVIQDSRFMSYGFNITLDIRVNTSCGGYMPISMISHAEILGAIPNAIKSVDVDLNGNIIYHRVEALTNYAEVNSSMILNFALPEIIDTVQYIDIIYTLENGLFFSTKAILYLENI